MPTPYVFFVPWVPCLCTKTRYRGRCTGMLTYIKDLRAQVLWQVRLRIILMKGLHFSMKTINEQEKRDTVAPASKDLKDTSQAAPPEDGGQSIPPPKTLCVFLCPELHPCTRMWEQNKIQKTKHTHKKHMYGNFSFVALPGSDPSITPTSIG